MRLDNVLIFLLAAMIVIMTALFLQHSYRSTPLIESSMNGTPLPEFRLPMLSNPMQLASPQTLRGHVFLVNFWASWCSACHAEQATLLLIARQYHVPIFGIDYKDNPENAKNWLKDFGNPFTLSAFDINGSLQQALEVYGLPQTFLVDQNGLIQFEFMGAIDKDSWETIIWPKVQAYENAQ